MPCAKWVGLLQSVTLDWFSRRGRNFPWRQSSNSFHVLVAEVLLRRTQAERVVAPYLELIELFPTPQAMAEADTAWLREWFRPLGLVSRANALVQTSEIIRMRYGGKVPRDLTKVESLPGLGKYSARAVLCLAYGWAVPMIDESSGRLVRRLLGLSSKGPAYSDRKLLEQTEALLPQETSRAFNLGLLDIAAAYCHVNSPDCVQCPLRTLCSFGRAATTHLNAIDSHS